MDSELSSFDTTSTSVLSVPESISMANNNVVVNNENQLQQQQQPQNPQQQLPQQPLPYHDPPYMIRHSRAFRHFKNPPQPHMCIKDHTEDGQELFINVMKWTKICMPHSASDPIPLYGGMRVSASMFRDDRLKFVPRVSFSAPNQFSKWFMWIMRWLHRFSYCQRSCAHVNKTAINHGAVRLSPSRFWCIFFPPFWNIFAFCFSV